MSKNILLFSPDWGYWDEKEASELILKIAHHDVVIYYNPDDLALLKTIWQPPFEVIFYLDILKKYDNLKGLSNYVWNLARNFYKEFDADIKKNSIFKGINLFEIDEIFWGSQFSWILRDSLIIDFVFKSYPLIKKITLVSGNTEYDDFVQEQAKTKNCNCELIKRSSLIKHVDNTISSDNKNIILQKIIQLIKNTFRIFFLKKSNKINILAGSHRNTIPIIEYLSKSDEYMFYTEGKINNVNENVKTISPNLISLLIRIWFNVFEKYRSKKISEKILLKIKDDIVLHISDHFSANSQVASYLIEGMLRKYVNRMPYLKRSILNYLWMISRIKPKIILMGSYVSVEQRILNVLAKKVNAVTIATEHGLMNDLRLSSDIIYTDVLGVWGKLSVDSYSGLHSSNTDKVRIVGHPLYKTNDESFFEKQPQKILIEVPQIIGKSQYRNNIEIFTPIASSYIYYKWLHSLTDFVNHFSKNNKLHLMVHPMDNLKYWMRTFNHSNITFSQGDAYKQFNEAEILVSFSSSTLVFDAIMNNLEVIICQTLDSEYEKFMINYKKFDVVHFCGDSDEVINKIDEIEHGLKIRKNIKKNYFANNIVECTGEKSLLKWKELFKSVLK
ncbi:MAG: hypothetical protein ABIJ15_03945 [bacterium]